MKSKESIEKFIGLYPVQKTLRFELIPQGNTLEHIKNKGLIVEDYKRAEEYKKAKVIIDNYHKTYIEKSLKNPNTDWNELVVVIENFRKDKSPLNKKKLEKIQEKKRKEITKLFEGSKDIFSEKLFTDILPSFTVNENDRKVLEGFNRFTTYFRGFHENRKKIYSDEAKNGAIAYRIVNENLPKFYDNVRAYNLIKKDMREVIDNTQKELKDYLKGNSLDEIFCIDYYNNLLSQQGIDFFNEVVGGIVEEHGGANKRGLNQFLNEYYQKNKNLIKFKMVSLFKQILSDRSTSSFVFEEFETDEDIFTALKEYVQLLIENNVINKISKTLEEKDSFDNKKIFIDRKSLSNVSNMIAGRWDFLEASLHSIKEGEIKSSELNKWMKKPEYSLEEIICAAKKGSTEFIEESKEIKDYFSIIQEKYEKCKKAIEKIDKFDKEQLSKSCSLKENKSLIEELKSSLDDIEEMIHVLKPFNVDKNIERDISFYSDFDGIYESLSLIIPIYNKIRNYITKKPYSIEKFKLNFQIPTLADGWDKNKEKDNASVILKRNDNYYLGIMDTKCKPELDGLSVNPNEEYYEKMMYKYFPDVTKMIPKCSTQIKAVKEHFNESKEDYLLKSDQFSKPLTITKEVFDLNNVQYDGKKKFQIDYLRNNKDKKGYEHAVKVWNEFCYDFLKKYVSTKDYDYSPIEPVGKFERVDDFYSEVRKIAYKISFEKISCKHITKLVEDGQLYLFQIYNKDFAAGSTGRPNLHTLYWKAIFDEHNLEDVVLKLNGQAELFYREKSIESPIVHEKGKKLLNRKDKNGQPIPEDIYTDIFNHINDNKKLTVEGSNEYLERAIIKEVKHEIVKDKRYSEDKFFFHVPITINFKSSEKGKRINADVIQYLKGNKEVNIIGIDRGERNLLYMTLINQKGEIIKQKSYNTVPIESYDKKEVKIDYYQKLLQKEKNRDEARKTWKEIGNIKNLKEGYLSQVVHQITEMMVKHNAIIVLEDLNFGFKRGRFKVERQVYQKFEKMLIDKLNYLAFKEKDFRETGGILKGYQMTEKFVSFEKLGKQSGFLFYIPAAYTSKIDPITGFVNIFDLRKLTNVTKKKEFFSRFDSIKYSQNEDAFVFKFNYNNFDTFQNSKIKEWEVYTVGKRISYNTKENRSFEVYPTKELKKLFEEWEIDYKNGQELREKIVSIEDTKNNAAYYDKLYQVFKISLQMRNSLAETGEDYIISPIKNQSGGFFISKEGMSNELPADADANGAYHIALKGLYILKNLKDDLTVPKITHEEWLKFAQEKKYTE